ncbi:hypothetical protein [uncultured Cohaesibacter sp.]|uniref:hypothetical protein n=1 Tax=uncultured Cohaesibacter sp. TaxID=1002546 RepID=UPI00292CB5C8|nr:hypothetical protein [uncultured Cohaesibacter sp.]
MADMKELPTEIFERSVEFLKKSYGICNDGRSGFSNNIIDDAFTIYNIYERFDVLNKLISNEVFSLLDECLNHIIRLQDNGYWYSEPPFGGSVDSPEYASAVIVRAAIARNIAKIRSFEFDLALALADTGLNSLQRKNDMTSRIESFWGPLELNDLGYCFIAMPFDRRRDEIYNDYVKKPIERKLKLKCLRVDEICKSTQIPNDIFNMIKDSSVVISDVSDRNSNVFYELGMAHVMGKPCVIIVEDKKDVPFDVASIRYIEYGNTPGSWKKLSEDIVKFVENSIGIEKS